VNYYYLFGDKGFLSTFMSMRTLHCLHSCKQYLFKCVFYSITPFRISNSKFDKTYIGSTVYMCLLTSFVDICVYCIFMFSELIRVGEVEKCSKTSLRG